MNATRFTKVITLVLLALGYAHPTSAADLVLEWDPAIDGITAGYVVFYGTAPQSYSRQIDVGVATSYALSGLSDGTTYYLAVRAYDANGVTSDLSQEVSASTPSAVPTPVTALSLTVNVPSPQLVRTQMNWLSTASGGMAPYQYQWALSQAGSWTVAPWGSASTWNWTPSAAGDYQVRVAVRSAGSTSVTGELVQFMPFTIVSPVTSVTLQSSAPPPQTVNTTIKWSAGASAGITPYQYKWWLFDGTKWTATTGWTTSSTWSWTPTIASDAYIVRVWVRSAVSTVDAAEASASAPFAIKASKGKGTCQGSKCR